MMAQRLFQSNILGFITLESHEGSKLELIDFLKAIKLLTNVLKNKNLNS